VEQLKLFPNDRVISWFSCGAASSYATYLAHKKYGSRLEAVYCRVREEHPDNMQLVKDYQVATGIPIKVIGDKSMNYSIYNVFRKRKFIKGAQGAPCTMILKKDQRKKYQKKGDVQVFGYTVEEQNRVDRFIDSNNEVDTDFILVNNEITKKQCLDWFTSTGLKLPRMYELGYSNNNCIGCVKGGMGYWNAIRKDFPKHFNKMAKLEREIGHSVNKDKEGAVYLDELDPNRGNFIRDLPGDCGFTCEWEKVNMDLI
tara:strand:+ start:43 stop:810 length:768 start_codon:yes stop_codon:yes gene_type:complete